MGTIIDRRTETSMAKLTVEGMYSPMCKTTITDLLKDLGFKDITFNQSNSMFIVRPNEGDVNKANDLINRYGYKSSLYCLDLDFNQLKLRNIDLYGDAQKVSEILEENDYIDFKIILSESLLILSVDYDLDKIKTLLQVNNYL